VVGHSSGEIAAAYACRAITAKEAILIAYYRGRVTKKVTLVGGMATIGMGRHEIAQFLIPEVSIACENSHESVTISGDLDKLETVMAAMKEGHPDVFVRLLHVEKAYHSCASLS
jgi:acyl transferase domain-containing protein